LNVTKQNLKDAVSANILSSEQFEQLIAFLNQQTNTSVKFDYTHALYYLGGLIAIGAMTLTFYWASLVAGWH
jgi:F0F1-type ATP synthase delta subunit